jgi:hypothetical protein
MFLLSVTLEIILRDSLVDILRAATSSAPEEGCRYNFLCAQME